MRGSLNFWDDPSHVRIYSPEELSGVFRSTGMTVVRAGTRRDPARLLLTPMLALYQRWRLGYVPGGVFWDLFGFAETVTAMKPQSSAPRET